MSHFITLIQNPLNGPLSDQTLQGVMDLFQDHNTQFITTPERLGDQAVQISATHLPHQSLQPEIQTLNLPLDVVIHSSYSTGRKKLLIADMDATIVQEETIDELAEHLNLKEKVANITQKAMNGEIQFHDALKERVQLLQGLPVQTLEDCWENISITPGAATLISTMKHHGSYTVLASGGFTFFTEKVKNKLGFNEHYGNQLEIKNGQLTGNTLPPILDQDMKKSLLEKSIKANNLTREETLSVGDGANDLPMLQAAGLGICFHGKDNVRKQISTQINHNDLTALLYVQGYHHQEFVE